MAKQSKGGQSDGGIGSIVNGQELARILGVSRHTVVTRVKQGMPVYDQNGLRNANRFDSAACIRWLRDRDVTKASGGSTDQLNIEEIRRRKELASMKKEEIELAVMEERYGDIEAILQELGHSLAAIRASLISLPKFASQMEHQDSMTIEKRLEEEVYGMLEELADFSIDEDDADGE